MINLTIIMPINKEQDNFPLILNKMKEEIKIPFVLSVIYDDDNDPILICLNEEKKRLPFIIEMHKNKYGTGIANAIKTGFDFAATEFVTVMKSDFSDPPYVVNYLVKFLTDRNADMICASRYIFGGENNSKDSLRVFCSRLANGFLHFWKKLPTKDATNSFKLFKKSILDNIKLESNEGYEIMFELFLKAHANKANIIEIPVLSEVANKVNVTPEFSKCLNGYSKWFFDYL